jgi:hypothetical protein
MPRKRNARCFAVRPATITILIEFDSAQFEENLSRIRIDFIQNRRGGANDSFRPVC